MKIKLNFDEIQLAAIDYCRKMGYIPKDATHVTGSLISSPDSEETCIEMEFVNKGKNDTARRDALCPNEKH